jgi:hypothetical protein
MILRCGRIGIPIFNSTVVWIRKKKSKIDYHQGTLFGRVRAYYLQELGSGGHKQVPKTGSRVGRPPTPTPPPSKLGSCIPGTPSLYSIAQTRHCYTHDQLLHPPHPPSFDSSLPISLRTPHLHCRHRTEPSPITHARDPSPSRLHHRHNLFPMLISP